MKQWIKGTFSDAEGVPSFKRQAAFFLILNAVVMVYIGIGAGLIGIIAGLVTAILTNTTVEKWSGKK